MEQCSMNMGDVSAIVIVQCANKNYLCSKQIWYNQYGKDRSCVLLLFSSQGDLLWDSTVSFHNQILHKRNYQKYIWSHNPCVSKVVWKGAYHGFNCVRMGNKPREIVSNQEHVQDIQPHWEISPGKLCNKCHEGQIFCWNLIHNHKINYNAPTYNVLFHGHYLRFWHSAVKVCSIIVKEHSASILRVNELGSGGCWNIWDKGMCWLCRKVWEN